jgi:hypothetical protein
VLRILNNAFSFRTGLWRSTAIFEMDVKHDMRQQGVTLEVSSDPRVLHVHVHTTVHRKVPCHVHAKNPSLSSTFNLSLQFNRAPPSFSIPPESLSNRRHTSISISLTHLCTFHSSNLSIDFNPHLPLNSIGTYLPTLLHTASTDIQYDHRHSMGPTRT